MIRVERNTIPKQTNRERTIQMTGDSNERKREYEGEEIQEEYLDERRVEHFQAY